MDENKIKAIIFDLDGTLVDSEGLHFEAHHQALENFGIKITKDDYIQNGVSGGQRSFYEVMQMKYGKTVDVDEVRKLKKEIYGRLIEEIRMFDGVSEKLEELSKAYRLAIASTAHMEFIQKTLKHTGAEECFETLSSAKDLQFGKPYPDVYFDSLKKLNLDARECVAVEDSHNGVEAAKNAGIKCIAIPNEFTKDQDLSRADIVIGNIKEINRELIENL